MKSYRLCWACTFTLAALLFLAACGPLWGEYVIPTATPWLILPPPVGMLPTAPLPPPSTPSPTAIPSPTPTNKPPILYYSQSGDSLSLVAAHFGVSPETIFSPVTLPSTGLLEPDTPLLIPNLLGETTPDVRFMPDSEVVYSPSTLDFDVEAYVQQAGGKLSRERYYVNSEGWISGAQAIQKIAIESSTNPRLLLALLQYESGWVYGQPSNIAQEDYPLGYINYQYRGLYQQMIWAVQRLALGYYGWREGSLTHLTFRDGFTLRLSPTLNAGTVAIQYYYAQRYTYANWLRVIDVESGFPALYVQMFGDPWSRAQLVEPLLPAGLTQPSLLLPFKVGEEWAFTNGPHSAWYRRLGEVEIPQPRAALDFAPTSAEAGCAASPKLVLAAAPGLVVRTGVGLVVLDLDGDGREQTGWVLLYLHIRSQDIPPPGTWLNAGDVIGHPSCDGGVATGTHVHIARKYNGEWILAAGPLPFNLGGWVLYQSSPAEAAILVKDHRQVVANLYGMRESIIARQEGE